MIRVLIAAVVAMVLSILVGPRFIFFLRQNEFGQQIREEGPEAHGGKQGTPTMGGLLVLVVATAAFLPVSKYKDWDKPSKDEVVTEIKINVGKKKKAK